jgi:hypothetical protein
LDAENISKSEKTEITDKSEITFKDSHKKLILKKKELKRERSRSHSIEKTEDNKDIKTGKEKKSNKDEEVHVIGKEEHCEEKYQHIKSEVIWNAIEFGNNKNKKDKFLRLMGANKHKHGEVKEDKELGEKIALSFKKIEKDLENQFDISRRK